MTCEDALEPGKENMPPARFGAAYAKWQKQIADGIRESKRWTLL